MSNNKLSLLLGVCLLLCTATKGQKTSDNFQKLRSEFVTPAKEYGCAPLYVWNTDITTELLDRTMNDLKDKGFGGVFVHPRPGLMTEYLSDEWFRLFRFTLDKGKKLGMNVWIYDENTFPSGFAGGHVNVEMPESYNQGQSITMYQHETLPDDIEKYCICLKEINGKFVDITNRVQSEMGKRGKYYLYSKNYEPKSVWHGGHSYVDLLYPGVTQKFLEVTGRGYERVAGDEFGKHLPGWFSDEPHVAPPGGGVRWTPDLFEVFEKQWGYDLKLNLPSLSLEVGNWKQVRHNYSQTLLHMFIDRWAKPCFEYCESKNLLFTGHYWEHAWPEMQFGPDNMAMYAWQQLPGIDMLMNNFNEEKPQAQFGNVRAVKELSSVANQMGYKRTLSETYGAAGWDETFRDFKRLGDWQAALGVNLMNQHLSHLSIAGARKYDCPTSFSEHSPWWDYYKTLNQHYARLSMALSMGQQINDILVFEPTTTLWFYYVTWNSSPKLWEVGENFQGFVTKLEKAQIEYDLGSENIIKNRGLINKNKFRVGKREYSTVVIPPMVETLDAPTLRLLMEFVANGGKLISFSKPDRVDGKVDERIIDLFSDPAKVTYIDQLNNDIIETTFTSSEVVFKDRVGGNLFHNRRIMDDGQLLFLVNSSLSETTEGKVVLEGKDAIEMNTLTGEMFDYPEVSDKTTTTVEYSIPPAGSLLLYVFNKKQKSYKRPVKIENYTQVISTSTLSIKPSEDNVLVIDFCDLEFEGKTYEDIHAFNAAKMVYVANGFKEGNPWGTSLQYKDNIVSRDTMTSGGFKAIYKFTVEGGFDMSKIKAVVEKAELYTIKVNGKKISSESNQWWVDRDFDVLAIGDAVKRGKNTLSIEVPVMKLHAEIEPIYILGDFALRSKEKGWAITDPVSSFNLGSWREQGWPFYSKSVVYTQGFDVDSIAKSYKVNLSNWTGTVAEVIVNGESAGIIAFEPYSLEVGKLIRLGRNRVEIKVVGSNKNLFGPFHNKTPLEFVTPGNFQNVEYYPKGSDYKVVDYGLMDIFTLVPGN